MQMQAALAAAAPKEGVLREEKAALEMQLQMAAAEITALKNKVIGISRHVHLSSEGLPGLGSGRYMKEICPPSYDMCVPEY